MELINQEDSYAQLLKQELQGIQKGKIEDIYNWTSKVSKFNFNFIL